MVYTSEKIRVVMMDSAKEEKIRARIMQVLSREIKKGITNSVQYGRLHKIVGCSIPGSYFEYLLETMQEEKLIMEHRAANPATQWMGDYWALWDHPDNVELRAWRIKCKREWEEAEIAWRNSSAGKAEAARKKAELVRQAQERFNERLRDFLLDNEEDLFELIRRLFVAYMPEKNWEDPARITSVVVDETEEEEEEELEEKFFWSGDLVTVE